MLKSVPKKKKKISTASLTKKLDTLVSKFVRLRDLRCIVCGKTENLQCGHYISRAFFPTRWDLRNCNAQCAGCNIKHEYDPEPYRAAIVGKYGASAPSDLSALSHQALRYTTTDKLDMIEIMWRRLKELEAKYE